MDAFCFVAETVLARKPTPLWQPLSYLSFLGSLIQEGLDSAAEMDASLKEATGRSHVLDDFTIRRVVKVYSEQRDDLWLYEEQLARWQKETLTAVQRQEIQRLLKQVGAIRETLTSILTRVEVIQQERRDALLNKSALQRELEALMLAGPPPKNTRKKRTSTRPTPQPAHDNQSDPFALPPEITVRKTALPDGWVYLFRHRTLGELGRLLVQDSQGQCYLTSEVAGTPDDPMTERRAEIFAPLALQLADRIESAARSGPVTGPLPPPPPRPPAPTEVIESKLMQCTRCDAGVALLIFAPEATSAGHFEDYARKMYAEYTRLNLPTWIIGPALGGGPLMDRPAEILQVWPERGDIALLLPAQFNPVIEELATRHCGASQNPSPPSRKRKGS